MASTSSGSQRATSQPGEGSAPDEQNGLQRAASGSRRKSGAKAHAAFIDKVYSMLQSPELAHHIAWNPNGKVFTVPNPNEFSREVLPKYFKHNNFQSFVRQLNMYGFRKTNDLQEAVRGANGAQPSTDPQGVWEFENPFFIRDKPDLLSKIKRRAPKSQGPPSTSNNKRALSPTGSSPESSLGAGSGSAAPERPSLTHAMSYDSTNSYGPESDYAAGQTGMDEPRNDGRSVQADYHNFNGAPPLTQTFQPMPSVREEQLQRHVSALESQVRQLNEALFYMQQETVNNKTVTFGVLRDLLHVVSNVHSVPDRTAAIESINHELAKLRGPEEPFYPQQTTSYLPPLPQQDWSQPAPRPMSQGRLSSMPYASSPYGSSNNFYYSPAVRAESYARGARMDEDDRHPQQHPSMPPMSLPAQNPYATYGPPDGSSQASQPHYTNAMNSAYARDSSINHPGMHSEHMPNSASTAPTSAAYASPRPSWAASVAVSGPGLEISRNSSSGSRHSETLPPLSALLELADPNRRNEELEYDTNHMQQHGERAHKIRREV